MPDDDRISGESLCSPRQTSNFKLGGRVTVVATEPCGGGTCYHSATVSLPTLKLTLLC